MSRARSGGRSLSPASVSTAARIAAIGVLSSCGHVRNEAPPHRLRAVALGHVPDDSHGGGLAGRLAVRDGADVDLEHLLGRGLPDEAQDGRLVCRRFAPDAGLEEPERLRIAHEIHERMPRSARGCTEEGERGRVRVEESESPVHDEEADRDLLEDGAREKARLLAALALRRDKAGEAGERDEDLLRLLRAARGRRGVAAGRGLGDPRAHALEVVRVTLADGDDEQRDQEAGGERHLIERPAERRLEEVEISLTDREPEITVRGRFRSDAARDVDEWLEDGGGRPSAEADPVAPRGEDLRARRVILDALEALGRDFAVAEHGSIGGDERDARAGLPGRLPDALEGMSLRPEVLLELGVKALELLDELAAAVRFHDGVQHAREGECEDASEDDPEEDRDERAAQDPAHRANLYPTPTTVSITPSPIFLRSERMWTSTVRVSISAA